MKSKLLLLSMGIIGLLHLCFAQNAAEVLTNKSIIDLYKAGFTKEVLISKIETSTCKFDVSTNAMMTLKKQQVPDDVVHSMINRSNTKNSTPDKTAFAPAAKPDNTPKRIVNIELLNHIHTYYNGTILPLEKSLANYKTKIKALGYGGVNAILEINGSASTTKLSSAEASAFVVKTGTEAAPDIILFGLKTSGKSRQAITGKVNMGGFQGSEGAASVNISKVEDGVFKIVPSKSLEKGEYFFITRQAANATANCDVYAFSIN